MSSLYQMIFLLETDYENKLRTGTVGTYEPNTHTNTQTHVHTHIHTYVCIYIYIYMYI